jgi:hypothetical protein
MLTEVKNNYKSILKHFDFDESVSSSEYKKQKLIEMAENKEEARPSQKTKLGRSLARYTTLSHDCYDSNFAKIIKELRPDWFRFNESNKNKQKLIIIAKNNGDRPNHNTKLGKYLISYISQSRNTYDEHFTEIIKDIRPEWFVSSTNYIKQTLIGMANNGESKPCYKKTRLGINLYNYTTKGKMFDINFNNTIRSLRPDWFGKCSPK